MSSFIYSPFPFLRRAENVLGIDEAKQEASIFRHTLASRTWIRVQVLII